MKAQVEGYCKSNWPGSNSFCFDWRN